VVFDPEAEAILKKRAEMLARRGAADETVDDVEVLICRLGTERYAIETRTLRAVQWVSGATPVPSTPAYVLGIVSVRGEIITLLDLATMIGLTPRPTDSGTCPVLLLGLPGLRCGLVVEEIIGVERLRLDTLQASITGREYTRGLAAGGVVVLDVEQLMATFNVAEDVVS
jgi:purine-binding chemotaxis protein CheW